jgi:hypothetical protein
MKTILSVEGNLSIDKENLLEGKQLEVFVGGLEIYVTFNSHLLHNHAVLSPRTNVSILSISSHDAWSC